MSFYRLLFIPPSPQISNTHLLAFSASRTGLISAPANIHSPPLSSSPPSSPFYPSSAVLLTSLRLSSFLLFFPISSAQMRCCVQRRVCTFLIAGSCPGIRWGKWACNETESTAVQTHTRASYVGIFCVRMRVHVRVHSWRVAD